MWTRTLSRINEQMANEYREAKKFELAMEREAKRKKDLAARAEQMELDEIGLNYHGRAV
jgi:flagellar biosynthesis chaperone FliJ